MSVKKKLTICPDFQLFFLSRSKVTFCMDNVGHGFIDPVPQDRNVNQLDVRWRRSGSGRWTIHRMNGEIKSQEKLRRMSEKQRQKNFKINSKSRTVQAVHR